MRKKILHIIDSLGRGGAEVLLVGIINELHDYENHLIILNSPETLLPGLPESCMFTNLNISGWADLFKRTGSVRNYIKKHDICIVHSHLYRSNILARLATPRRVKVVNSIHAISSLGSYKIRRASLYLEKLTYRKSHHIVAVSREVMNDFDHWVKLKGPHTVLYNYVDDSFFNSPQKTDFAAGVLRMVAVGNLRHQKNYPFLIEAFKQMPPDISLDIYGEGELRESLQRAIDKYNLPIRLLGSFPDLSARLTAYDCFVMSSFFEGQPVSLLEAMACGLPALLADIPVLREVAGDDAVYFDAHNPGSLVEKAKFIAGTPETMRQLSRRGRERVAGFAMKADYMKRFLAVYGCRGMMEQEIDQNPGSSNDEIILVNPGNNAVLQARDGGYADKDGNFFPVVNGAVRIVTGSNYTDSFGFQWKKFEKTQIDKESTISSLSKQRFFIQTGWDKEKLAGRNILEVGCGAGRFSQVVLDHTQANLYSIDYSDAVSVNFKNNGHHGNRLHLFQASIYDMPFPDNSFEKVFCFGVLQHTPDFRKSIQCLVDKTKPGGELVIDFYPINSWWTKIHAKYLFRPLIKRMSHEKLIRKLENNIDWLMNLYFFFDKLGIGKFVNRFLPICDIGATLPEGLPREELREWVLLDTFDMFSPQYDSPQKIAVVKKWFGEFGMDVTFSGTIRYGHNFKTTIIKGVKK